jgi:hypothetical protein
MLSGADVSWPNCPKGMGIPQRPTEGKPMPDPRSQFVVVGLTNGPGFTPNPCLASQVAWAKARHMWTAAYAVATYPTPGQLGRYGGAGTLRTKLIRTGIAQAEYNIANLRAVGLKTPVIWVDVEPYSVAPWSSSHAANNAVIRGVITGYRRAGYRVGLYSYAYGWREITGGLRSTLPTWVPTGTGTRAGAAAMCRGRSFSGGPVIIGQWANQVRDVDLTCPWLTRPANENARIRGFFAQN